MPPGDGTPSDDFPALAQRAVYNYVRGQLLFSVLMGASAGLLMWAYGALGIFEDGSRYALAFGAWFGLMELVPYVGPVLGAIPPIVVAAFDDPLTAVWVGLGFLALQQLEGHVVAPQVFGRTLRLNPLIVLFALLLGGEISRVHRSGPRPADRRRRPRDGRLPAPSPRARAVGPRPARHRRPAAGPPGRRDGAEVIRIRRDTATRLPTRLEAGPPSRTAIRGVRPGDADDLLELRVRNRDFLAPWDPLRPASFFTRAGQAEWIALQQRAWADDRGYGFAVLDVEEADRVVGGINLFNIVRSARQSAGMGYWIDEAAGSRGHATAAVRLASAFAFEHLGLHRARAGGHAAQRALQPRHGEGGLPAGGPRGPVPADRRRLGGSLAVRPDRRGLRRATRRAARRRGGRLNAWPSLRPACGVCGGRPRSATWCARRTSHPRICCSRCSSRPA